MAPPDQIIGRFGAEAFRFARCRWLAGTTFDEQPAGSAGAIGPGRGEGRLAEGRPARGAATEGRTAAERGTATKGGTTFRPAIAEAALTERTGARGPIAARAVAGGALAGWAIHRGPITRRPLTEAPLTAGAILRATTGAEAGTTAPEAGTSARPEASAATKTGAATSAPEARTAAGTTAAAEPCTTATTSAAEAGAAALGRGRSRFRPASGGTGADHPGRAAFAGRTLDALAALLAPFLTAPLGGFAAAATLRRRTAALRSAFARTERPRAARACAGPIAAPACAIGPAALETLVHGYGGKGSGVGLFQMIQQLGEPSGIP
jgi:hypothetical protein